MTLRKEALRLKKMGLKVREIAKLLGKSHSTIVYHTNAEFRDSHNKRVVKRSIDAFERLRKEFGGKCLICGYDEYLPALHFHHIDPKEKSFSLGVATGNSYESLLKEAQKCVLVCAICHAKLHGKMIELPRENKARSNPRQTAGKRAPRSGNARQAAV